MLYSDSLGAPRLGLSAYPWWSEALHGVGFNYTSGGPYSYATSFPMPILMSAAFDDDLVFKIAEIVSTEARAYSNAGRSGLDFWTPNINPYKDPRWGRGGETPGEDPRRIKGYVKALLAGLEGDQKIRKVIATCKHYAGNDLERWQGVLRHNFNAIISIQDLVEYYLPPFQQCARDSKVGSFMCAYNSVNGTPACANTYLMQTVLREHWGWTEDNNYITSDCGAIHNMFADHKYSKTEAQAAAQAYAAGTDTVCEFGVGTDVLGAYNQSLLPEAVVDKALKRLYEGLVRAGYFDPKESSAYRNISWIDVNTLGAQTLALQAATDGLVLKKNDGTLPLPFDNRFNTSVAIIGHWANNGAKLLGGYAGPAPYYSTPAWVAQSLHVQAFVADGPVAPGQSTNDTWTAAALEAARKADYVLYFGGNDLSIESEDRDRMSIAWPQAQLDLIDKLCALGKPCVVVELGDQNDDTPLLKNENVSSIIWAGWPGQAGGTAVFDVLYGRVAPAGRLPVTQYPASYVDQVPMTDMTLRPSPKSPGRTYKWYDGAVLPFGSGLHYTNFSAKFSSRETRTYAIAALTKDCKEKHIDLCPLDAVSVAVTNTGTVDSDFVALLFVNGTNGPAPHPIKELVAYSRLRAIQPGDTKTALLRLTLGDIARVDARGNSVLYSGSYTLQLDVPTQDTLTFLVAGEEVVLDEWPQPPVDLGAPVSQP
jgi:xylan 1,4-beta-xylosidase